MKETTGMRQSDGKHMRVIGITGGVGSGKTALLAYIEERYRCRVLLADEMAHQVMEPGQPCYEKLIALLSRGILQEDGRIHKGRMAAEIFGSQERLKAVNGIIHPAVKEKILEEIRRAREEGELDFFFVEAALLIEDGYLDIVDEMWYIYSAGEVRRKRLKESRNYSDEKIKAIMESQLTDEEFRKYCSVVIDNNENMSTAFGQIDRRLGEYL